MEQTINSVYAGEPAELDLHPDVLVNPSHDKVFATLDALGLARIPGDGEDTAEQPDGAADVTPEPAAPKPSTAAKRATGTGSTTARKKAGAG